MEVRRKRWWLWVGFMGALLCISWPSFGQTSLPKVRFVASANQQFGFDDFKVYQWRSNYLTVPFRDSLSQAIPYKSMLRGSVDHVNLFLDPTVDSLPGLRFEMNDSIVKISYKRIARDTLQLELPAHTTDYLLRVYYKNRFATALQVINYEELNYKLRIVPLAGSVQEDSLSKYLNHVYAQAGMRVDVVVEKRFELNPEIDTIFANPSVNNDRYTDQMAEVRDNYFDRRGMMEDSYYLFIVADFVSPEVSGYMVRNKGVGFVEKDSPNFYREIAHQLGYGIGHFNDLWKSDELAKGSTVNLMDVSGTHLTHEQWEMARNSGGMVSFYDDYENIRANNGIVAYYLWEESEDGTIIIKDDNLLGAISRPFKRNTYSLYLNIDNFLFVHLFNIWKYPICLLHLLALALLGLSSVWVRKIVSKKVAFVQRKRYLRFLTRITSFIVHLALFTILFFIINEGYYMFEVDNGKIDSLNQKSVFKAEREALNNQNVRRKAESEIGSEVLIKRGEEWFLEKRAPVLYFDVRNQKDGKRSIRLNKDSKELHLPTLRFRRTVQTHYFVFRYVDTEETIIEEKVFNHLGINITDKLALEDPAERILLFVNGYRPTSLGNSFEENFEDVRKKGLEFPDSYNVIHREDRYNYWTPWNKINEMFTKRLNATATYYADGHHSVATSNHKSLIDFTRLSLEYPKRCKNPKHHVCKTVKRGWKWLGLQRDVPTYETQPLEPNEDGFNLRRGNGRIAGRNLLQFLNEMPSNSDNDTLYIVAHSMGYAYALGIIDKVRGRMNFGGFYIIAAENAESGSVQEDEWKEIWQYGGDFEAHKEVAPCLLDGIAPQSKVGGLSPRNRVYIPETLYTKMGFFESHFIGHYTWIFDLPQETSGYIEQR